MMLYSKPEKRPSSGVRVHLIRRSNNNWVGKVWRLACVTPRAKMHQKHLAPWRRDFNKSGWHTGSSPQSWKDGGKVWNVPKMEFCPLHQKEQVVIVELGIANGERELQPPPDTGFFGKDVIYCAPCMEQICDSKKRKRKRVRRHDVCDDCKHSRYIISHA